MRDRDPPNGFASATMKELIFCRRCPASRMNCKLGSCTAFSYRSLFFVNHSLLLFFARSRKNAKNSVVKYVDFSPMRGPPRVRIRFPQLKFARPVTPEVCARLSPRGGTCIRNGSRQPSHQLGREHA